MARRNQNLTPDEAAVLRRIAAYHGYYQRRGPGAGTEGSALALILATIHGDVQMISLEPEEIAGVVPWLAEQAAHLPDGALREALTSLAGQLGQYLPPATEPAPPPTGAPGPINTLEG